MERVTVTVALDPGIADAELRLADYFENRRMGNGKIVVPLRLALEELGFPGRLAITRRAIVTVNRQQRDFHPKQSFDIEWRPLDGALFPALRGRIVVWPPSGGEPGYLELQGSCFPADGDLRPAYHAGIGHLIAQRAATTFLEDAVAGLRATGGHVRA